MNQISSWNENELDRLLALSNLGIDYYEPKQGLNFLTELAAKVSGTEISLINLIDSFTQWSVSTYGIEINQMPREDSVCQYTIQSNGGYGFEVDDLAQDIRFKDKFYVAGAPNLRYYMGVPLTSPEGYNLGALCVMDPNLMQLSEGVKDILRLIALQIVDRLRVNNLVVNLKAKYSASELNQKKLAHDIRGPIGGILGLSNLILDDEQPLEKGEMEEYVGMIKQSSHSLLDLSNDILGKEFRGDARKVPQPGEDETNLVKLRETIVQLLAPQLKVKKIKFEVVLEEENKYEVFSKLYVLQILGNLLSNSIKFTETGGSIVLNLKLIREQFDLILAIEVCDTGLGMAQEKVGEILRGEIPSIQKGTGGEQGFGLGLTLVSQLVKERNGNLQIYSELGKGTSFKIEMQVN
ncbi:GAF domain-containing sensor histidine kinase [Algoriphagus sp. NG3]|uniref:GAF domain-containing sensor histidine kinase n=1 Tax=unclassified Algoriphagus TaxID=2641541 RepID=UPI002A7F1C70|nr:GAF domain-containing sensor histidine kinase [Algoriphagus sp. NG3]WPR76540.1 GAF domain-containing sensor histidine kinase [Algoriphagus sp. NG3]